HIATDLLKTAWATYLCELCDAVPEQLPDAELFELLSVTLAHLDAAPNSTLDIELIGRWFEARFLALLGYSPTIGRCVACEQKIVVPLEDTTQRLAFSPLLGGTLCAGCASRDPQRLTVSVQTMRALHKLERAVTVPSGEDLALTGAGRRDLRDCLRASLYTQLEIKLKSQSFLEDVAASQLMGQNDV
ncbi:MAG: DNA repair protein RecO, partial [Abitibacteriaceae bacterium]|nr:DNA repair protein RecO [Abditibacteriaceae bacterium]